MVLISIYDAIVVNLGINTTNNEWIVLGEDAFIRIGVTITALITTYLLMRYIDRRPWSNLRLKIDSNALTSLLLALVISTLLSFASVLLSNILDPQSAQAMYEDQGGLVSPLNYFIKTILLAFFLQGFPEELNFRGYLSQTLETTPNKTLIITSLAFGFIHIISGPKDMPWLIVNFFASLFFGALAFSVAYTRRTTWAAIGVHAGLHIGFRIAGFLNYGQNNLTLVFQLILYLIAFLIHYLKNKDLYKPENNLLLTL